MKALLFAIFVILLSVAQSQESYQKIIHNTDPEAKCLDGTPAALFLHEGSPKHILFYMVGGASCGGADKNTTVENCYQRSKTYQGSSTYWAQTLKAEGILSTDLSKNIFANWTKVIMIYCDGAFHQGYTKAPLKYKDAQLYFRGNLITKSHFKYIDTKYGFGNAQKIVLTGSSAGGIAAFAWADYLKSIIPKTQTKFYLIPDSGIFLDPTMKSYGGQKLDNDMFNLLQLSNKDDTTPNKECGTSVGKDNEYFCLTIQGALPFLKTQALFIQSSYDQYIIRYGAGFTCLKQGVSGYSLMNCSRQEMQVIEGYRQFYLNYIVKLLQNGHNIWSISCSWHANIIYDGFYQSPLQKVPMTSGKTMQQVVFKFLNGQKVVYIDTDAWPGNLPCAF